MKKRPIMIGLTVFAIVTIWNSLILFDWRNTSFQGGMSWQTPARAVANASNSHESELWRNIKKTIVEDTPDGGYHATFEEYVLQADGERVELPGVGFLINSGVRENDNGEKEVIEFLLLPGDGGVAWCCGLSPIPNFEFSVLVRCPDAPFPASVIAPGNPAIFVSVQGILKLEEDNSIGALYTLDDAVITYIEMKDVMPPDVMNLCLKQPMIPPKEAP